MNRNTTLLRLWMSLLLTVFVSTVWAMPLSEADALQKAFDFIKSRNHSAVSAQSKSVTADDVKLTIAETNKAFYVFNNEEGKGYVIVSADDRMPVVLGYSYTGTYNQEEIPENMREWLNGYVEQYEYLMQHKDVTSVITASASVSGDRVYPLLESQWSQYYPYNNKCPEIDGELLPTGCVATAMAQIMYYYQWPKQTSQAIPGYTTKTLGIVMPSIGVTTIDWDNMLPTYSSRINYSTEQEDAISTLLIMCGTAVGMDYDLSGSGASTREAMLALSKYFDYPDNSMSLVSRSSYYQSTWNQMIYDEISKSRPVLYSGQGPSGGHAFIIDGYDQDDYFHVNWGWGGNQDDYFLLTSLNGFDNKQYAVIGIDSPELTPEGRMYAYATYKDNTLTFYYDTKREERPETLYTSLATNPWQENASSITSVVFDESFIDYKVTCTNNWFKGCKNLTSINLKNLNTERVIDMSNMFYGCSGLTNLDVSGFNTEKVTDMRYMFYGCTGLESLDVSGFNTASVTDMRGMFWECSGLKSLDVSKFVTEKVTNMDYMFYNCSGLTSLDVSGFNTANVTSMRGTFRDCSGLTSLDVCKFNTANVTDMQSMFSGCSGVTSLDVSKFNTANVTNMDYMFYNCSGLTSLDVSGFNTANVTSMRGTFRDCSGLTSLDVCKFNTANVTDMQSMFSGCSGVTSLDVSKFNTANVTNTGSLFYGCRSLTSLDVRSFNTTKVTDMSCMFLNCYGLTNLDLSNFVTENVTNISYMFSGCSGLTTIYVGGSWSTRSVNSDKYAFMGCRNLVGGRGTVYDNNHTNAEYARIDGEADALGYFTDKDAPEAYAVLSDNGQTVNFFYDNQKAVRTGVVAINRSSIGTGQSNAYGTATTANIDASFADYRPNNTAYWFMACKELTSISGMEYLNTSKATNMQGMFRDCSALTSLDVSKFNTANVTDMSYMFYGCTALTSLDASNFNTTNVTNMQGMFRDCSALTSLDVSKFNTANVTDMSYMFYGCTALTSLDASNFNTTNVTNMRSMFRNCSSLTSLDVCNFNTANVTDMRFLFYACSSLTSLDVSHFTTEKVTDMAYMFSGCSSMTSLDMSNLNTAKVTDMRGMFSGCIGLSRLDVSSFNTEKVTDMAYMFFRCISLTMIYAGGSWSTTSVTSDDYIFSDCGKLVGGQGTVYTANHTGTEYARIDGGTDAPGYFTDKNAPTDDVVLTAKSYTREYGEANTAFEYDVTEGMITSGEPKLTSEASSTSSVGTYDIVISKGTVTNRVVELVNGTLTITKAPLTISCGSYTIEQGEALPDFVLKYSGWKNGETADVLSTKPKVTCEVTKDSEPGTYEIVVSGAEAENYEIIYVAGKLTVTVSKDDVVLTAKSYTREYGEGNPALEYLVSEGTITSGEPSISCDATAKSPVGTYDIVISKGTVSNNGTVSLVKGMLTITKAPLTIKANSYTIKQGEALPEFKAEYEGFKNGETDGVLTKQPVLTTSATSTSEPGTYDILVSGAEAENYEISYVKGMLTIKEAEPVKVTAKSYTIEYGESIPAFEYSSEGAALSGVPEISCEATTGSAVGTYDIVISKGSVSNFNDTYVNGTLTITKAPLTISVGEYTRQEGEENPEFELTYEGFKNGESDGVLTKLPVVTCVATKDSEPGDYVITIDGAEAENYDIRYASGKLTVTAKPLPEITPIEGEMTVNTEGLSEGDLTDNVVNDVYYNVCEGGYDATDKSIVISKPTNMAQITDKEPGSKDVKENFNGMILKVAKGKGLITVNVKTSGNAQLVVQVGNQTPMLASKTEKGDVVFRYDVEEDTYVYVYAIIGSSAAKGYGLNAEDTNGSVRIYNVTVSPGVTGIKSIGASGKNDGIIYDLQGRRVENPAKGIYIMDGRKVSVK